MRHRSGEIARRCRSQAAKFGSSMYRAAVLLAVAWAAALCWFDVRERRLPNWLTIGGALVALTARFGIGGVPFFTDGLIAALVAGIVLLLPFFMRGAGGGDVKMLFAAGAITGWAGLLTMLWAMSLAGIVFGMLMILAGRLDSSRLRHGFNCAFNWRYDRKTGAAAIAPKSSEKARMPFSIPIAAGLLAALAGGFA